MADLKISQLNSIVTVVPATDVLPVVQGGTTLKITPNQILGAGGTATLASATITGDLTVATNRLIVNSVGVSTGGSPAGNFGFTTVGKTGGFFANKNAANQYLALQMKNSTQDYALYIDQDGVGSNSWSLFDTTNSQTALRYYPGASGFWNFHINGGVGLTLNATSNLVLKNGTAGANGVGVTFPATQVASSDANCLDDYEEGTWTIGLAFGGASTGITSSANQGKYTKVGRQVTVTGYLGLTNKGTATGDATITGLPFPIANSTENYSAASLWFSAITPPLLGSANQGLGIGNTSVINLSSYKTDGSYSNLTNSNFANNSEIALSFTYYV